MDNVTHTLVGVALGHTISRAFRCKPKTERAVLWASLIGSNIPDIDGVIQAPFIGAADRMSYLLQHRGYTHTFLFSPAMAALTLILAALIARVGWQEVKERAVGFPLTLSALFSVLLHVGADFCNEYGVHPFSPMDQRWVYGDTLFILEPSIWLALLPFAFFQAKSKIGKGLCLFLEAAIVAASWLSGVTPKEVALGLLAWAIAFALFQWKRPGHLGAPLTGLALVVLVFFGGSRLVRSELAHHHETQAPRERLLQLATSPAPANPFCWRTLLGSEALDPTSGDALYLARLGTLSLWPEVFPPQTCFFRLTRERTAPLQASTLPSTSRLHWQGEFRASMKDADALAQESCLFRSLLHFARFPFWVRRPDGAIWVGDLRYDNEAGKGFTEFVSGQDACPALPAKWTPPGNLPLSDDLRSDEKPASVMPVLSDK